MEQFSIPKIDISCLFEEQYTSENCKKTIHQIDKACRQIGFFTVVKHPIKTDILHKTFQKVRQFFYLSPEDKLSVSSKKWNPSSNRVYRGYFPSNVHGKQGLDIQDPQLKIIPQKYSNQYLYETNQYPKNLSEDWEQVINRYFSEVYVMAIALTKAIFYAFERPQKWDQFKQNVNRPYQLSSLRFNYYPKKAQQSQAIQISEQDGQKLACETHVDSSIFTLLSQDSIGGLQVKSKDNVWRNVPYQQNAFIINTGRTTELLTNGIYKPTYHRVKMNYHERISIPFFFQPTADAELDPHIFQQKSTDKGYIKQNYGYFIKESLKKFKQYQRQDK